MIGEDLPNKARYLGSERMSTHIGKRAPGLADDSKKVQEVL